MKVVIRIISLALFSCLLSSPVPAQKDEIRILRTASGDQAVPGQLVLLFIEGISLGKAPLAPLERFQVLVTQSGQTQPAPVRMATEAFLPKQAADSPPPPAHVPDRQGPLEIGVKRTAL